MSTLIRPRTAVQPRYAGLAAAAIAVLALGGCASAGSPGGDPPAQDGPISQVSNDAALAYIGGTEGVADEAAEPIVVGFVTQDGGIPGWPETVPGAEAAVEYVNSELGGIGGRPLELRTCLVVSSEEEGQRCGQEMANDADVAAVVTGQMIVGNASLYNTVGNSKPVFGTPTTPADYNSANNFDYLGAGFTGLPAMAIYAATTLGAENVAMVYADEPGGQAAANLVAQYMDEYGVDLTKVPVATTSTDVIGSIVAARAQQADVFLAVVTAPLCIQIAKAQEQLSLDVPVVSTVLCTDQAVEEALGDLPSWTFGVDTESPFIPEASEEAAIFVDKLRQYGGADANVAGFAAHPFAKILTVAKLLNEIGPDAAGPEALFEAARDFTGPMWMGGPEISCGVVPDMQSICNTRARLYSYVGDGVWEDATDGQWIDVIDPPQL
jgi:branched-chain amino acid transport system substrate-binding protein